MMTKVIIGKDECWWCPNCEEQIDKGAVLE